MLPTPLVSDSGGKRPCIRTILELPFVGVPVPDVESQSQKEHEDRCNDREDRQCVPAFLTR
jgi:hypothetical protein